MSENMFGKIKINQQSWSTACIHFDLYIHNDIYKKSLVTLRCREYRHQQQYTNQCFANSISQSTPHIINQDFTSIPARSFTIGNIDYELAPK
jgi:hypothetical protein